MIQPNPQSATLSPEGAKHTPKWKVIEQAHAFGNSDLPAVIEICEDGSRYWVALVSKMHRDKVPLFAAAPELLDALKDLFERERHEDDGSPTLEAARDKARAAIRKATEGQ